MNEQSTENLRDDHMRGVRAQELLSNPLMAEVLSAMERDLFERFKVVQAHQADEMAELRRLVGAHQKFQNILRGYIANGEHAARLLADAVKKEGPIQRAMSRWRV